MISQQVWHQTAARKKNEIDHYLSQFLQSKELLFSANCTELTSVKISERFDETAQLTASCVHIKQRKGVCTKNTRASSNPFPMEVLPTVTEPEFLRLPHMRKQ